MPLFQNSVLNKYLKEQDKETVQVAFDKYRSYFHNPDIQRNILEAKEEQFQEGFLRELFVKVFGYVLNPWPDYNLTTEYKNEKGSKKADGAVLNPDKKSGGKAVAVIELKSTKTKDLESIRQQAFDYKANQTGCVYVITSNFQKLRFYINDAVEFEEFDLFILSEERFEILFLCLNSENLLSDLPLKIKNASILEEEQITKKFYADYSLFKKDLFESMVNLNMGIESVSKLQLYKKTQKLLDRFLFIFFAEDRGLLPPNSISRMIKRWNLLKDEDAYKPLYEIFKQYFGYLNKGRKGKVPADDIHEYNGGLFLPDDILDKIKIDDDVLLRHTSALTNYDFESSVDVNILGHIFEHSLNEIESTTAELEGIDFDKQKSKRKKDGVFYTPKYITKYIVDNTVGKLCEEKKTELGIREDEFTPSRQKETKKRLLANLEKYRTWLLELTICDPACGSGAFLNQALEYLISEHHFIDDLNARLFGSTMVFQDVENQILENNIFGVDINEESVDIARLSLWLRTAQRGRKLTTLNKNIKCGNSLIDDPEVAGDKAFRWEKEFPEVFKEKDKEAYHITTATHDSRTSQRMIDFRVREKRDGGARPKADPIWLDSEDELLITKTIAAIVKEDNLNMMAFNICGDHMHFVLVCEKEDVDKIAGKIKSISARTYNIEKGITIPTSATTTATTRGHATTTRGHVPLSESEKHAPLSEKDNKKKSYNSLWTQKFSCTEIKDDKQLWNTIEYIETNREKHELEINKEMQSIIDDMCCDYDHAFRTEYKGGFDVVIGNPPYVFAREKISQKEKDFYSRNYNSADYQVNTYLLFVEKTIDLIKINAFYGLIVPNAWLMVYSGQGLRKYILDTSKLNQIINLEGYSFDGVNVETIIILSEKKKVSNNEFDILLSKGKEFTFSHTRNQFEFLKNDGIEFKIFSDKSSVELTIKLKNNSIDLNDLVQIKAGLQAYEKNKGEPKQTAEDVNNRPFDYTFKYDENTHRYLEGKDVNRYFLDWSGQFLLYGKQLAAPRTFNLFDGEKIIVREITGKYPHSIISTYSDELFLYNRSNIAIIEKEGKSISLKYIVAILNSQLMAYYFVKNTAKSVRKMFPKIILNDLRKFPFKEISMLEQIPFITKADKMLALNQQLLEKKNKFLNRVTSTLDIDKISKKIDAFYEYDFKTFVAELKKQKNNLSLIQQDEWEEYFNVYKTGINQLQHEINKTDKEIDQMVYALYGLTEEEVAIVEKSVS